MVKADFNPPWGARTSIASDRIEDAPHLSLDRSIYRAVMMESNFLGRHGHFLKAGFFQEELLRQLSGIISDPR